MKKSKLLSVLTAGAVIATTVGTYAAWDSLEANTTAQTVTFRKPVTVTVDNPGLKIGKDTSELNEMPKVTGTVKFTVNDTENKATKLTITPTLTANGATIDNFDIVLKDTKNNNNEITLNPEGKFVDESLNTTEYTVEVTPKNEDTVKEATDITLKLTAELSGDSPVASSK